MTSCLECLSPIAITHIGELGERPRKNDGRRDNDDSTSSDMSVVVFQQFCLLSSALLHSKS